MEPCQQEGTWLFFDWKPKARACQELHFGADVAVSREVRMGLERIKEGLGVLKASDAIEKHAALRICSELRLSRCARALEQQ